jgi:hypothetical protein
VREGYGVLSLLASSLRAMLGEWLCNPPRDRILVTPDMLTAIISVFIGNFLVGVIFKPSLERLWSIRAELLDLKFPTTGPLREILGKPRIDADELEKVQSNVRRQVNEIFREYRLAFSSFRKVGWIFLFALFLMSLLAIWSAALPLSTFVAACVTLFLILLAATYYISDDSFPSFEKLHSIDHFSNHYLNFYPDTLIDLMELRVIWSAQAAARPALALSSTVQLTGYKFFLAITDFEQTESRLVVLGKITEKTDVLHVIGEDLFSWVAKLTEIDPKEMNGLFGKGNSVWVHLYVFLPMPLGWHSEAMAPYVMSASILERMGGQTGFVHSAAKCNSSWRENLVKFTRRRSLFFESWNIETIDAEPGKDNYKVRKLLWFYHHELENASSVQVIRRFDFPQIPG